ncbi:indole-diterpene biosynthesis protein [Grosmannia clavigera kw1407]|uniref:Indole-diterpene biosynthesis protein n=1 Tax=Grosmannia clavigera (strain kw1407 / UAMH 11150) TaxID=655863 RepID=F0XBM5_GROCL|nr:indole-diterpene biosynthesis protein [Grosmannia clavigera kw1407]EFX05005.1 indole-diterpene biosynthesis protein [Grosmannia clavigera kw1407]
MAVNAASDKGFPGFEQVTEQIWIQRVDEPTTAAGDQPTTVLLFGWGNGQPRHVAKYAAGFRVLFPQATIVAVLSPILQAISQGVDDRTEAMRPLVDLVWGPASLSQRDVDERILVHVMSNGGGIFYAATLNAYARSHGAAMPHDLLVCDSTPGGDAIGPNLWCWARAVALGVAAYLPGVPFVFTQALCAGFLAIHHVTEHVIIRRESAATFSCRLVNDQDYETAAAHRLYLYSAEDDIVRWQDVVAHAADARQIGYDTTLERFAGSPHVGHMRQHPEQYWGAIEQAWAHSWKGKGANRG